MKKTTILIAAMVVALFSKRACGQTYWNVDDTGGVETTTSLDCSVGTLNVTTNANIGQNCTVGNILNVQGGLMQMLTSPAPDMTRNISAGSAFGGININSGTATTDGSVIAINGYQNNFPGPPPGLPGQITLTSNIKYNPTGAPVCPAFAFQTNDGTTTFSNLVTISNKGWLGINTSTPGAQLDVKGSAIIDSNLTVGGNDSINGNLTVVGNGTVENNLTVGFDETINGNLNVHGGQISLGEPWSDDQRNIFAGTSLSGINISSGYGVADGAAITLNAWGNTLPGQITFISNTYSNPIASPVCPAFAFQTTDGTTTYRNLVTISNTGWVGINDSTPGTQLEVTGNAVIDTNLTVRGNDTIGGNLTVGSAQLYLGTMFGTSDTPSNIFGGSLVAGLNINAGADVYSGSVISIHGLLNDTLPGQLTFSSNIASNTIASPICPAFTFQTLDNTMTTHPNLVTISNRGWVGVNTASPRAPLEVNGKGIIDSDLTVGGNDTIKGNLIVNRNAIIDSNLTVVGNWVIDHNLTVGGNATIDTNLTVRGGQIYMVTSTDIERNITAGSNYQGIHINSGNNYTDGSVVTINAKHNATTPGQITLTANTTEIDASATCPTRAYAFQSFRGTTLTTPMQITYDGKVVIGDDLISSCKWKTDYNYNLYVSKGILTERLKVAFSTDANWSDYVFDKDYKLMPLAELESFVKTHKHMPGIPTAGDVAKTGIDVADMDAKLLKNEEETKLYIFAQQKQIDELKKELAELKKLIIEKK